MKNIQIVLKVILRISILACLFLSACAAPTVIDSQPGNVIKGTNELKDVIKSVMPSTVIVVTYDDKDQLLQQGSGFFVSDTGEVITNYHVMSDAAKAAIKTPNGGIYTISSIIAEDVTSDLIKLQADIKGSKVQFLTINKVVPEVGEKVVIIGSPVGLESTVSDGIISAVRDVPGFGNIIQTTAPISPGSSGSPVVNMNGEVWGVASAQMREGQNLNFVIPSAKIIELNEKKQTPSFAKKGKGGTQADDILATAMFYYLKDNYGEALPFFIQYLKINPESAFAWFGAGHCCSSLGRYEEAIQAYKEAIRLKPDFAAYNNLANTYHELGRNEEAFRAIQQAIRLEPEHAGGYYNLGNACDELGRYEEAIQAYKKAIRLKPDYVNAHYNMGISFGNLGRYEEAIQAYREAIRLKPDFAEAHNSLGNAYRELGRYEEAIQAIQQAIRLKPGFAKAYMSLGLIYDALGRNEEAIQSYEQAIRLKPDAAAAYFGLGMLYDKLGRNEEEIQAFQQSIHLKPDFAMAYLAYYFLGQTYGKLDRYEEAIQSYKQAIRLKPDDAAAHHGLGLIYSILGRYTEAIPAFHQAIRLKPDYANAHFGLGGAYLMIGDRGRALEEYKILKELDAEKANKLFNVIYK